MTDETGGGRGTPLSIGASDSGGGRAAAGSAAATSGVSLPPQECGERRRALGLSAYDLARLAGLQERTVIRFEAALVRPRPGTIVALRNALRRAESAAVIGLS